MVSKTVAIVGTVATVSVGSFVWEHIGRKNGYTKKPSTMITNIRSLSAKCWSYLGTQCARLSSFYNHIKFGELRQTFSDLVGPTGELVCSPLEFFNGYFDQASNYKYPTLVVAGSLTFVAVLGGVTYWFRVPVSEFVTAKTENYRDILVRNMPNSLRTRLNM